MFRLAGSRTVLGFALAIFAGPTSFAADCSDILNVGVHDTYSSIVSAQARHAYSQALCDGSSLFQNNGTSINAGGSYGFISANGDYNQTAVTKIAKQFCQSGQSSISEDQFNTLASMTVDPFVVSNWRECMAQNAGLVGYLDRNGGAILINLSWKPEAGVAQVNVKDVSSDNLDCKTPTIQAGSVIAGGVDVTMLCARIANDKPVTFVVNTSGGSKILKLSADGAPQRSFPTFHYSAFTWPGMPAPAPGLASPADVKITDYGPYRHYQVRVPAPQFWPPGLAVPPGAHVPKDHWAVVIVSASRARTTYTSGGDVEIEQISGAWKPGDEVAFVVDLPTSISSANGWSLNFKLSAPEMAPFFSLGQDLFIGTPIP
jgi:hypothetical protein